MKQQYTSYQQGIEFLRQAMGEHPHLIRVQSIGESWEQRPIMLVTISQDVAYADHKPAMLYTGTIHAREWIGHELAVKFVQYVIDNYRFNPQLLSALTRNTLYMVPCLNPDGFEYSRLHYSFWRKNRRPNNDGSFGVDLNRNFSVRFRRGKEPSATTYSGPEAFSEPETRAMRDFVEQHSNIRLALDYHSQGNVFFPAHKFNHEAEIDGTDLNVLCANMNHEIKKVTGHEYGIHRGKPPMNLIHGSGREYYYAKGILATVVEVGTRNIPDYMTNMSKSIDANIPALIYALSEAINYSPQAPQRVDQFTIAELGPHAVTLQWEHAQSSDVFFEIYRSETNKAPCRAVNRIAVTKSLKYTDVQLKSGHKYYYNIRAVDRITQIKSPFSPELKLKTLLAPDEYSLTLFPAKQQIGYVAEHSSKNREHFGHNSMFIGINRKRGICYGVVSYALDNLPADAHIKSALFSLYPMNRVGAKIEKFGEWSIAILDPAEVPDPQDFDAIHQAVPLHTLGQTIASDNLTQGIWSEWQFNGIERLLLEQQIGSKQLLLRFQGPLSLPRGNDSQLMQFDIGYGPFGGGIHYRPSLELIYTVPPSTLTLSPAVISTIYADRIEQGRLASGFDEQGRLVYGQMAFALDQLPDEERMVITDAYLTLHNKSRLGTEQDIRFTVELVKLADLDHQSVRQREKIEFIGYEISHQQLGEPGEHHFIFDSYSRTALEQLHSENQPFYFVIRATAASEARSLLVDWHDEGEPLQAQLVINYVQRRKQPLAAPQNLQLSLENNLVRLSWQNPQHEDFVGAYVVRNRFHPPRSPFDGVKLYGGPDDYTYDKFGNTTLPKYYAVFSYDDVPNFSQPAILFYKVSEDGTVVEPELEELDHEQDDCS